MKRCGTLQPAYVPNSKSRLTKLSHTAPNQNQATVTKTKVIHHATKLNQVTVPQSESDPSYNETEPGHRATERKWSIIQRDRARSPSHRAKVIHHTTRQSQVTVPQSESDPSYNETEPGHRATERKWSIIQRDRARSPSHRAKVSRPLILMDDPTLMCRKSTVRMCAGKKSTLCSSHNTSAWQHIGGSGWGGVEVFNM